MDRVDYETYETQNVYDSVEEEKSALPSEKKVTFFAITLQLNFLMLVLTHSVVLSQCYCGSKRPISAYSHIDNIVNI